MSRDTLSKWWIGANVILGLATVGVALVTVLGASNAQTQHVHEHWTGAIVLGSLWLAANGVCYLAAVLSTLEGR